MKRIIILPIIIFSFSMGFSQKDLFLKKEYIFKGDTLKYRILFPENYDKTHRYPVVLFLHGAGERGSDNEKQLVHGSSLFTNSQIRNNNPSIVIFPQCPSNNYWVKIPDRKENKIDFPLNPEISKPLLLVKKLMDSFLKTEGVDKSKIYVMGLSMGGMGTFDLICRYPKYFTAAIPICGGINIERLGKSNKLPIRIFHGSDDNIVSPEFSQNAYKALISFKSKKVEYVEFPGIGHNSWDSAFVYPDFLSWLYSQKK